MKMFFFFATEKGEIIRLTLWAQIINLNLINYLYVPTQCAKDCGPRNRMSGVLTRAMHGAMHVAIPGLIPAQASLWRSCLSFFYSYMWRIEFTNETCKKLSYKFFDNESHDPWHSRYDVHCRQQSQMWSIFERLWDDSHN